MQGVKRGGNVGALHLNISRLAFAVAHAPVIEAHHRMASSWQRARQKQKLPVAINSVLWTARNHDYAGLCRCFGFGQNARRRVARTMQGGLCLSRGSCKHRRKGGSCGCKQCRGVSNFSGLPESGAVRDVVVDAKACLLPLGDGFG